MKINFFKALYENVYLTYIRVHEFLVEDCRVQSAVFI